MPGLTPRELTRKRWLEAHPEARRADPPRPPLPSGAKPVIGPGLLDTAIDRDVGAARDWAAHLAAGRIGVSAPAPTAPPPRGCDYGLASLARILGRE